MFKNIWLGCALSIAGAIASLLPGLVSAQDRDSQEVASYVLTEAGLAKYTQATKNIAALPVRPKGDCDDDDSDSQSLDQMAAKLNAAPGAKAAIQSAGMTTREYMVFSLSVFQNGLAAWALRQPGGKLPAGLSKANVDFYNKHAGEIDRLGALKGDDECGERADEDEDRE
jgi:hypothetical protein